MASHMSFVISGLLLVVMTVSIRSAPIAKETVQWPSNDKHSVASHFRHWVKSPTIATSTEASVSTSSLPTPATTTANDDRKKKRDIDDSDEERLYALLNENSHENEAESSEQTLHAQIKETVATAHDNADHPVDTDDSVVFSEGKMNPSELSAILRRRRDVKANDPSNRRRKRALSSYDLYDSDGFYDPVVEVIERHPYVRPTRSFAPLYWYPPMYERSVRSVMTPDAYESAGWPLEYANPLESDDDDEENSDESPVGIFDDDNDEENVYEVNRYPILVDTSKNPFDNLQLQQAYNTDDIPLEDNEEDLFNEDDDDDIEQYRFLYQKERPHYTNYGPFETYN